MKNTKEMVKTINDIKTTLSGFTLTEEFEMVKDTFRKKAFNVINLAVELDDVLVNERPVQDKYIQDAFDLILEWFGEFYNDKGKIKPKVYCNKKRKLFLEKHFSDKLKN